MRVLFHKSGIDSRGTVLPTSLGEQWKQRPDALDPGHGPRTAERMKLCEKFAGPLAESAALGPLDNALIVFYQDRSHSLISRTEYPTC